MLGYIPLGFTTPRGKEKRVFSKYEDCAAAWIRQRIKEGACGYLGYGNYRMIFFGPVIYSYGEHYPIARLFYVGDANVAYVLVNNDKYSRTTDRQRKAVLDAIEDYLGAAHSVFNVSTPVIRDFKGDEYTARYVYEYYRLIFQSTFRKADNPRLRPYTRERIKEECKRIAEEGNRFAKLFGEGPLFPDNEVDALKSELSSALSGE